MATYVLVHGAWAGGWCWRPVARRLRAAGHDVLTPTLTGSGERSHLASPEVGVDTHVDDVLGVLTYEDCSDVVLVGHSYGGTVVTAVAEAAARRIARLVYVDGFVPRDGECTFDAFPAPLRSDLRAAAAAGDGWRIPSGPHILDLWGIADPDERAWVAPKLTAFPLRCFEQAVKLPDAGAEELPRTYVLGEEGGVAGVFGAFADRARAEGWDTAGLPTGHASWITASDALADALLSCDPGA